MPEERRPFRATDVLSGAVEKGAGHPSPRRPARPPRKQVSIYLTYPQVDILNDLHHRLNAGNIRRRIEKSELGGLAIELLAKLVPEDRHFQDISQLADYLTAGSQRHTST